jgi:hypothetical protein
MEVTEVTAEDGGAASKTEPVAAAVAVQSDDAASPAVATTTAIDFEALKTLSDEGKEYLNYLNVDDSTKILAS